ncbi:hypothetical protein ZWY2020_040261 [Hordeum vulgare]|nr:hypothetical protein ZWY2020_040261 [Hordeum vulgare]
MYRSSTTSPAGKDPARVAYRVDHVTDAILALPDDDSEVDSCNNSDDEVEELVVLSDDMPDVQLLAPVLNAVEGHKNLPIDVEKPLEVADLPEVVVVKQEVLEEDVVVLAPGKKKRATGKKTVVRHSTLEDVKKEE